MVLLAAVFQLLAPILTCAGPATDEQFLTAAKSTLASQIEPGLPDEPIEAWLASLVGNDVVWTWALNDCGEQSGVPEIDKERDLPICADLAATDSGRQIFVYFLVGFNSLGVTNARGLYFVGISDGGSISSFDSLASFATHLRTKQD